MRLLGICVGAVVVAACTGNTPPEATYAVTVTSLAPPQFAIRAELPLTDDTLRVAQSWPCDLDVLCRGGWPALITDLRVTDAHGRALRTDSLGRRGWVVRDRHAGRVVVEYAVSHLLLAQNDWPAPRETAYADSAMLFTLGRALFVGTTAAGPIRVRFVVPPGVHVSAAWLRDTADGGSGAFTVPGFEALVDNGIVFRHERSMRIRAGQFSMELALFGRWSERRDLVTRLMGAHLTSFTRLLGFDEPGAYLAVFLDDPDMGGESFLSTHALSASPDSAVVRWGRLIGHEVFHYWNGHRIRGADYTSSQWFQEGMTEYYAILSMARNGFITPAAALDELSRNLRAHREFGRSLAASGNRKNRGFYASATMVAFVLDVLIRDATDGRRSLDDLMRQMWITFGRPGRPYTQAEVFALAGAMAGRDLDAFFQQHVEGDRPLPLDSVLPLAGLTLARNAAGEEMIVADGNAPPGRRELWRALIAARPPR